MVGENHRIDFRKRELFGSSEQKNKTVPAKVEAPL
jgi:hypothetical protein